MRLTALKSLKLGNMVPKVDRGAVFDAPARVAETLMQSGMAVPWQAPEESPALKALRAAVSAAEATLPKPRVRRKRKTSGSAAPPPG